MLVVQIILIFFIVFFTACDRAKMKTFGGEDTTAEKTGISSCTVSSLDEGGFIAKIDCPDGSSLKIPSGQSGVDGINGTSCTVDSTPDGAFISCDDGSQSFVKNGIDGHSCKVESIDQYASLIKCSDGSSSLIDLNSHIQSQQVEIIDPCGDNPGEFDELILRFGTGDLIAYFEQGSTRFLTRLVPGNYQTTDQQKCNFNVSASGDVVSVQ